MFFPVETDGQKISHNAKHESCGMSWERARSEDQKEERIQSIIQASLKLFDDEGFEKITFGAIAELTGRARSNLYKYFPGKSEIFLEILGREISAWRLSVIENLPEYPEEMGDFVETWTLSLVSCPRLTGLLGMLNALEEKASEEALRRFKGTLREDFNALASALVNIGVMPDGEQALDFLAANYAQMQGTFPMLHLSAKQIQAMENEGISVDSDYYLSVFRRSLLFLIEGFRNRR